MKKTTVIFDNYDFDNWIESAKENLSDLGIEITDESVADEICFMQEDEWDNTNYELKNFFKEKELIITGTIGRWNGKYGCSKIFDDWENAFECMIKDCDYFRIEDNNGELTVKCSHHDGDNCFNIHILSERGIDLFNKWAWNYSDKRAEKEIYDILFNNNLFSVRPWFAKKVYGC